MGLGNRLTNDVGLIGEVHTRRLRFDVANNPTPTEKGHLAWADDFDTVEILLRNGSNTPTVLHIGHDEFFYVKADAAITRGQVVHYTGTEGASGHILAAPFLADGTYESKTVIGVAMQNAAVGEFIHVLWRGVLRSFDTSLLTPGILYASTTVAGGYQSTVPVAPNNLVTVAVAVNQKNNGTLIVRPTFAPRLVECEDVLISNPQNGDVLTYDSVSGLWKNQAP